MSETDGKEKILVRYGQMLILLRWSNLCIARPVMISMNFRDVIMGKITRPEPKLNLSKKYPKLKNPKKPRYH